VQRTRTIRRLALAATAATLLVSACGDGESEPDADAEVDAAALDDASDDVTDAGTADADPEDADEDADAPAALEASAGWGELHTTDLPAPGTVEIVIDGQPYTTDAECTGWGEVPDEVMDGNVPLNDFLIYNFSVSSPGRDADDLPFRLTVGRDIVVAGDLYLNITNSGWGGDGQFDLVSFSNDAGVSRQQSPSSADPTGAELPLVRVDPGGGYTAQGELTPEFETDEAPTGPFTLTGQCQAGWPDDRS
jgi:hypothetical protein